MDALQNLGIDGWGIVLYLGNFGLLILLMHRYVYRPLVKMLDKRRETIKTNVEEAERLRKTLASEKAEEEKLREKREAELEHRIREVKKTVKEQAKTVLQDAEAQREAILTQASAQANRTIDGALSEAEEETKKRIKAVALAVLDGGVPESEVEKSVSESWKRLVKEA